jgi:translocation and assembly module TamB
MTLRKLRNLFFSFVALLLILLATLSALVETQTGSRWLVTRLAALADVTLGPMTGNIRRGFDIEFVDYQQGEIAFRAEYLSFRWRPVDLLYGALMIDSLNAQRIHVHLPPSADDQPDAAPFSHWPSLRLPVRVQLRNLDVRNISYQQGEQQLHWEKLSGDVGLGTFNLRYRDLTLVHSDYELRLNGRTSLDYPYQSQTELHWQWQQPTAEDGTEGLLYRGVSRLEGSLPELQLDNDINSPMQLTVLASGALVNEQRELNMAPALELTLEWAAQTLPAAWWMADKTAPISRGLLKAEGNWQQYRATLEGAIQLPDAPALALNTQVDGNLDGLHIQHLTIRELGERLLAVDTASSAAASSDPAANVTVATAIPSKVQAQALSSVAAVIADEVSPNSAARLNISGDVHWSPALEWQLAVETKAFNLAGVIDNWPSHLNASFTTSGSFKDSQWQAALRELQVAGELRGVNVQGSGEVAFDGTTLRSDALELIVGANQVQLKGVVGNDLDLNWNINAPLLHQIDESLSGSVISRGELRGDRTRPRISVTASASEFSWGGYAVEKLELSLAPAALPAEPVMGPVVDPTVESPEAPLEPDTSTTPAAPTSALNLLTGELLQENYQLNFVANRLHLAQQYFSSITLNGSGSVAKHQVQSIVRSPSLGRADIGVQGEYNDYAWQGSLSQLAVKLKKVPRWWLTSSKPIRVSTDGVLLGEQCLTTRTNLTAAVQRDSAIEREQLRGEWQPNQSPSTVSRYDWLVNQPSLPASSIEKYNLPRLCIEGDWASSTGVKVDALLDAVPLRQFLSLFKTEVYFAGVMDGSLTLKSPDLSLAGTSANFNVTTRNAELRYQYAGGVTDIYPWRDFALRAQLQKAQLTATTGLEWVGFGRMGLNSELDLQQQKINRARLQVAFNNIAPLETLLPFTNDVKGELSADLSAGGSFSAPYLLGDINLRNGGANMTRLGLDLTGIEMHINSTQTGTISLLSEVKSGDGRMTLVGDLKGFGTAQWNAQAFINGTDFRVVSLPQLKANLSPNIKVTADASSMHLTGEAVIPWARANIKSLPPSATKVSSDVVIVDEKFLQEQSASPFNVYSNLNLSLGKDVSFKGFGLSSKLTGRLNLLKEAHRPFFTNGYVSVSEGSYKAYGQTLTIERGRLAFQGPYDDPGLDIRATRQIRDADNTKVGLDIDGTLQRPKAKVFSSPSTSESQAMMMLLTGKPIKDASDADASLLLSAMSGLGMDSGGSITAEINRFFGVDQLEVKADDGIEQSQLWVGKYLTPRLLVRYVVGIFDQAFSFGMEYQLTDNLRLEAESGETKSVDVIYKIER